MWASVPTDAPQLNILRFPENSGLFQFNNGDTNMSKLLNLALAAAFGLAVSAPLYAADSQNKSAALSDSEARAAMDKCNNLTATAKAKCIVNIRPIAAGDKTSKTPGSDTEANVVKDGNARAEEEYSAAAKQCESVNASDRDRCITAAKEKFGRM
jgi:hypothetical protein